MSGVTVSILIAGMVLAALQTPAQTTGTAPSFTATSDHVEGAPDSIRINLMRWSTDAERDQLLEAWGLTGPPPTGARGAGRGARPRGGGAADPALEDDDPTLAGANPLAGGPGGAGRGGQGGRGVARGGTGSAAAPRRTPESSLAAALAQAPSVGYLWSSEVAGYALRYAVRLPQQAGERVVLITDRRLGAWNDLWKPVGPTANNAAATSYEFSVIELRLNPRGEGEGKISLSGTVALDRAQRTIALENYNALPVILKNVRRQVASQ